MEKAFSEIFAVHSAHIDYTGANVGSTLVVFSAIPGSGKSELTKRLARDYAYLRIANKDIRDAMAQTGHAEDVAIGDYTLWLFDRLTKATPVNIVFDRNIDQWYEPARAWALENNYRLVTVAINVTKEILQQRLLNREGSKVLKALGTLDFYSNQHEDIKLIPGITLVDDYDLDKATQEIYECTLL